MSDEHFAHRCELFDAADMRIAEFADEDLAEWNRECMHRDADWNPLPLSIAVTVLRLMPKPDLNILGEM